MRFEMKMPDLATTDSEIRVVRWLVEPGRRVERGQPLLEVQTDKAAMEVESTVGGILTEVVSPVDAEVSVGRVIAVLEVEESAGMGETPISQSASAGGTPTQQPMPQPTGTGEAHAPRSVPMGVFARNRAAAAQATVAPAIPLSIAQRVAGKRLQESKQTVPHFYLQTTVDASAIIARRKAAEPENLPWDAFFVLAVAKAIGKFDRFRCRLDGDRLIPIESDAIGVAVDDDGDLYVLPVVAAAGKTLEQISAGIRFGVERLRSGDPEMRKIRPTLMTVSNLGVCNVEGFLPIINPPEPAILGVGKVRQTAAVQADGRIGVEPRCTLSLCVDHRVAAGKYAGDFLGAIVDELERF